MFKSRSRLGVDSPSKFITPIIRSIINETLMQNSELRVSRAVRRGILVSGLHHPSRCALSTPTRCHSQYDNGQVRFSH